MVLRDYKQLRIHFYKNLIKKNATKKYEQKECNNMDLLRQDDWPLCDNECHVITACALKILQQQMPRHHYPHIKDVATTNTTSSLFVH